MSASIPAILTPTNIPPTNIPPTKFCPFLLALPLSQFDDMGRRDRKKLFLLTYPRCELQPQELHDFLFSLDISIREYVIAREEHKDGAHHLHAYIRLNGEGVTLKDAPPLFEFKPVGPRRESDERYWGNVTPVTGTTRSVNDVVKYCVKDDGGKKNYLSNIDIDKYLVEKRKSPDFDIVKNNSTRKAFRKGLVPYSQLRAYAYARSTVVDSTARDPTKCIGLWLWGPVGTGKSLYARIRTDGESLYNKSHNKWWDQYNGEKYVLIDDLSDDFRAWSKLKLWVDVYPVAAETKGGSVSLCYDEFIVTSNHTPRDLIMASRKKHGAEIEGDEPTVTNTINETLIKAIESRFHIQEFKKDTFKLLTGLDIPRDRTKTLSKPLCIPNAQFPSYANPDDDSSDEENIPPTPPQSRNS